MSTSARLSGARGATPAPSGIAAPPRLGLDAVRRRESKPEAGVDQATLGPRRSSSSSALDRMKIEQEIINRPPPNAPYDPSFLDDDDYHLGPRDSCGRPTRGQCKDTCVAVYLCNTHEDPMPEDDVMCCAPQVVGDTHHTDYSYTHAGTPNVQCF